MRIKYIIYIILMIIDNFIIDSLNAYYINKKKIYDAIKYGFFYIDTPLHKKIYYLLKKSLFLFYPNIENNEKDLLYFPLKTQQSKAQIISHNIGMYNNYTKTFQWAWSMPSTYSFEIIKSQIPLFHAINYDGYNADDMHYKLFIKSIFTKHSFNDVSEDYSDYLIALHSAITKIKHVFEFYIPFEELNKRNNINLKNNEYSHIDKYISDKMNKNKNEVFKIYNIIPRILHLEPPTGNYIKLYYYIESDDPLVSMDDIFNIIINRHSSEQNIKL